MVETALASHLSPDGADRLEAALARRLDRMTRQLERMERHVDISNEALALFVRFWLTSTPPLPDAHKPPRRPKGASATKASSRRLGRRLARGRTLADEIIADIGRGQAERRRPEPGGLTGNLADRLSFYPATLRPLSPLLRAAISGSF